MDSLLRQGSAWGIAHNTPVHSSAEIRGRSSTTISVQESCVLGGATAPAPENGGDGWDSRVVARRQPYRVTSATPCRAWETSSCWSGSLHEPRTSASSRRPSGPRDTLGPRGPRSPALHSRSSRRPCAPPSGAAGRRSGQESPHRVCRFSDSVRSCFQPGESVASSNDSLMMTLTDCKDQFIRNFQSRKISRTFGTRFSFQIPQTEPPPTERKDAVAGVSPSRVSAAPGGV
jgi:hypothetical protein